ncbi:HAD family hydrolase [Fictibacillus aquaticus]|uniref:HAD family hydrolase n=1 Tax=Fictibacillus aquaticus TaxID=2021314 RepID=UPI0013FDD782|nr:HAD family hydrolase [Fictibacillus aquaticus]
MNNNTCFFFDLDDTLIDYEAAFEQASFFIFTQMHPECDVRKWFRKFKFYCDEYWKLLENGKVCRTLYQKMRYEQALTDLGLAAGKGESEVFHENLAKVIPRFCVPFSWVSKLLSYFFERDIAWGIISNGFSRVQRSKLKVLPVKVDESLLFISEETGFEKPDIRYFHFVQEKTGFSNLVYVGNSYEQDVAPAAAAGWKTIWLNSSQGGVTAVTAEMAEACFIM